MQTIRLLNLCPNIFLNQDNMVSDIWRKDITFEKGKVYLVEAMSGTGKSSLCNFIYGYRNDYDGSLMFDNTDARQMNIADWAELRCKKISYLIQDLRLFPELTAYENIEIKNNLEHRKSQNEIMNWLESLDIIDKCDVPVGKMSFGQQQKVAMIRALVQPFDFLLADEPISHLDDNNAKCLGGLLLQEAQRQNAGIILTSIGKRLDIPYDKIYHL